MVEKKVKCRDSNMELLRIITMFFILMVHADFYFCGVPDGIVIVEKPYSAFIQYYIESITIIGVNVFIFLSGWYGINLRWSRLGSLVFQVFFWVSFTYIFSSYLGKEKQGLFKDLPTILLLHSEYPFVKQYVLLYLFSPVLNLFVEKCKQNDLRRFLIVFFIFQLLISWLVAGLNDFNGGNSCLSFMGLYLLARYIRIYKPKISRRNKVYDLTAYIIMTLLAAIMAYLFMWKGLFIWDRFYMYNSPFVIIPSISFVLFFSKLKIKESKSINWVATSCFAVYLFHCSPYMMLYGTLIRQWFEEKNTGDFILYSVVLMISVYIVAILIDKLRLLLWNGVIVLYHRIIRTQSSIA